MDMENLNIQTTTHHLCTTYYNIQLYNYDDLTAPATSKILYNLSSLGVNLPVTSADSMYAASRHATGILVDAIIAGSPFELCVYEDLILVAQRHHWKQLNTRYDTLFSTLCARSWILFAVALFSILMIMICLPGCLL